jgi:hypothetical protein
LECKTSYLAKATAKADCMSVVEVVGRDDAGKT